MKIYDISFRDIIYQLLPHWLRMRKTLLYLYSLIKPIKDVNIEFLSYYNEKNIILKHNAQTIYLQHYLNYEYDPFDERILIENTSDTSVLYRFNKAESPTPLYYYNQYNNSISYSIGDFVSYGFDIYECISATTGNNPSDIAYWSITTERQVYHYNDGEVSASYNFAIWIPDSIKFLCGFPNFTRFKAQVNQFNFSDKKYTIIIYV